SALVEVTLAPRAALARAGVSMPEEIIIAIERLNEILRTRDIAFSIRSALSVRNARERATHLQLTEVDALDHVLVQEVLSKVRLFADDPRDVAVVAALKDWAGSQASKHLPTTCEQIARWEEDVDAGIDVLQA
ncbi:MAG TPA: hypothetical protein VH328_10495, partial [Burkholderiaceae bacterium]|nr:hypothetical protein [Burkholderiaceae bacterium]